MARWTSTLFRWKVAIILRMFHILYFITVFWWLRWCVILLLMSTPEFECCVFGSLPWKIVHIFLKRRKGGMWQSGPNLSSGIRWCLALASVRLQWCQLWHFDVCACVCGRVNGGPDLVCVMEAIWNLGIYQLLHISGACNVCPSCFLWLDPSLTLVMSVSKWGC